MKLDSDNSAWQTITSRQNRSKKKRMSQPTPGTMTFIKLCTYKTKPCELGFACPRFPRKIVNRNQYLDCELECLGYHHEQDKRRIVLNDEANDFLYSANYAQGRESGVYSENFFESLFHPLYFKLFPCQRPDC
jgi:hypothetical protein